MLEFFLYSHVLTRIVRYVYLSWISSLYSLSLTGKYEILSLFPISGPIMEAMLDFWGIFLKMLPGPLADLLAQESLGSVRPTLWTRVVAVGNRAAKYHQCTASNWSSGHWLFRGTFVLYINYKKGIISSNELSRFFCITERTLLQIRALGKRER